MFKSSPAVSNLALKIVRAVSDPSSSENRLAKFASRVAIPLIRTLPLAQPFKPMQFKQGIKSLALQNFGGLGAVRAYSSDLPLPKRLVDCYQAVLEDAILNQRDIIEIVDYESFCIASYVKKSLDAPSSASSNVLGNGYLITGIKETWQSGNTPARMYELQVQPPEVAGKVRKPFILPVTVFKTEALREPRPDNLRALFGLCSIAVKIHSGKLPRSLYGTIKIFSSSFGDLGKLYLCAESIRTMILNSYISTNKQLFHSIRNHLNDCAIDLKSPFVPALRLILVEEFRKKYPLHGHETQHSILNDMPRKSEPDLFRHDIAHKGGGYRAAMKLNAFAKGDPGSGVSAICVTHSEALAEQTFSIVYDPRGVWIEKRPNAQTGETETVAFVRPEQLSGMLKQRGVQAIISRPLGML